MPMTFNNDKANYLQMCDRLCDEILAGRYKDDERIPSIREYAVMLQVNSNTAVKAYEQLARSGIIYNKRGLGYFVTEGARLQILESRRQDFVSSAMPEFIRQMKLLDVGIDDFIAMYHQHNQE